MNDFNFKVPQDIIFGKGCIQKLPELLQKENVSKVLVISGPHLNKIGSVDNIMTLLQEHSIAAEKFIDVEANPSVETVEKAATLYKESGSDAIIAFGGGSPMDVAKAVGVISQYGGTINDYEGAHLVPGKIPTIVAIPTTAGTGSEVTAFSVITDHQRNYKLTVFSYELIPAYALLDPDLIVTLPASIAAATGMDALVHALESYLSKAASPFTEALALKALKMIGQNIRAFVADRTNETAASEMLTGSMLAGIAFAWSRLGNVHAMAHPVSGYFNVSHGVANAILLPVVLEYNALADSGKYKEIYNCIKISREPVQVFRPSLLVSEIRQLNEDLGIPKNLSAVGVTADKIPDMAKDAMKSGNILVNPRQSTFEDIKLLFQKAL
ncbi:iron-containing alcohol dehydrogenase family protein [Anaeromicropila populeti]|uniref:Alcohol dehydrogenase n=1 Tax=Anaeromicropila populeti TaxID=37658 RepID=A0A1I6KH70_9FIRM|nr:iron-containing alcohol dehydrogenase [Anaeromicropila populeti]SFR90563.1 alcohol dehydrogenase [Anaeromicropila populeti]